MLPSFAPNTMLEYVQNSFFQNDKLRSFKAAREPFSLISVVSNPSTTPPISQNLTPTPRIRSIIPLPTPLPAHPQTQRHLLSLPLHRRLHFPIRNIPLRRFVAIRNARSAGFFGVFVVVVGGGGFRLRGFGLREIFPFAPAVKVDEGLHAAPFHDFAGEPFEVHGL